jgi:transposase InsO family protein
LGGFPIFRIVSPPCRHLKRWKHGCFQPAHDAMQVRRLATVVDMFSRRVVGWSMNAAMTAQLVTDAPVMAIWRRGKPEALLHHSDRGSQYTSEQFQRLMADHGVVCSMSRSGLG